jgi:hypothetical protein
LPSTRRAESSQATADADAIARLRLRTPSPEREAALAHLPPDEVAEYGEEVEVDCIQVQPPLPRKQALTTLDGCAVEVDVGFRDPAVSYLEFVATPKSDRESVLQTTRAIIGFLEAIRQAAFAKGTLAVPIQCVIPDCPPDIADRHLIMLSPLPMADIQTTTGVSLADFARLLEHHPNYNKASLDHRVAGVEQALSQACGGDPVSPNLKGFINTLVYYMDEAKRTEALEQTVHGRFNFMLRSDFCSIYRKLLAPEERAMARVLLLPLRDGASSLLTRALNDDGSRPIFGRPYSTPRNADGVRIEYEGPTIDAFLASIVRGPRDLLSPPEGCPPGYGMGLMGVDTVHQKMIVELRGHQGRHTTMANHLLVEQTQREYNLATRFNSEVLGPHDDDIDDGADEESWTAVASKATEEIGRMFSRYVVDRQARSLEEALDAVRDMPLAEIEALQGFLSDIDDPDYRPEVRAAMDEFSCVVLWPQESDDDGSSGGENHPDQDTAIVRSFNRVMDALWLNTDDLEDEPVEAEAAEEYESREASGGSQDSQDDMSPRSSVRDPVW